MGIRKHGVQAELNKQIVLFLSGIILSFIVIWIKKDIIYDFLEYMNISNLIQSAFIQMTTNYYLIYLMKNRFIILFILFLTTFFSLGNYILDGFIMFCGIGYGSMVYSLLSQYRLKGILVLAGLILPQMLIYVPVYSQWILLFSNLNDRKYGRKNRERIIAKKHNSNMEHIVVFFRLFVVTIIGIVLECYVNPKLLQIILKNI